MAQAMEKRDTKAASPHKKAPPFNWEDPLDLEGELTEDERMVRDTARGYAQDKLMPRVLKAYREEKFDREILREMGELGLLGADHPGGIRRRGPRLRRLRPDRARDGARRFRLPLRHVGAVLAGDVSDLRLRQRGAAPEISAQARQRRDHRLLRPDRARLRLRSGLDGDARREGRRRLQAQRRQDVDLQCADRRRRVVWAKLDGKIRGFIVERGTKGFSTPKIEGKLSLRASITGEVVLEDAVVPEGNLLPNV